MHDIEPRHLASRPTSRATRTNAVVYSAAYPTAPGSRAERVAVDLDSLAQLVRLEVALDPLRQTTVTCIPARVRARASCQTRRSAGTDRFSTTSRVLQTGDRGSGGYEQPRALAFVCSRVRCRPESSRLAEDVGRGEVRWVSCVLAHVSNPLRE